MVDDIRAIGLRNPIMLYEGQVLDGWNRYQACITTGAKIHSHTYTGSDPVQYVKSQNWHRRHLSASQRAAAITALSEWRNQGRYPSEALTGQKCPVRTNDDMATEARVSPTLIKAAKTVHAQGSPELQAAVRDGSIPVQRAAEIARLPETQQRQAIEQPPRPKVRPAVNDDYAKLKKAYDELADNAESLAAELATCEAIRNSEEAKTMNALREELRVVVLRRDELMREVSEMRKQIEYWKRQAGKVAA